VIELKERLSDRRALLAAATQLALGCERLPGVDEAYLVLWDPRLAGSTIVEQWNDLQHLFRPTISNRLRLASVWPNDQLTVPDDERTRWFAEAVRRAATQSGGPGPKVDRTHEVLKLLILRRFWNRGPIKIKELQAEAGLSHPTVKRDLDRLGDHVARQSDRSVELARFPQDAWSQLRALAPRARHTAHFADGTGRKPDLRRLVDRLRRLKLENVALGGVIAAREWQPDFDLEGTPRIDLSVHAPDGRRDVTFIKDIDAALQPSEDKASAAVVVHSLVRAKPHFKAHPDLGLIADPIETLLDLYELRLYAQADEFLRTWKIKHS
jgi:hypothetical protein